MRARFHNKTRRSKSIPQRLIKEKKIHLIPLYYLLINSCLAKEAVLNSGSYLLADHIYKGKPKGDFLVGKFIDQLLLSLPSAKSFRNRFIFSKKELYKHLQNKLKYRNGIKILSVPCGIPRDLIEVCLMFKKPELEFIGLDLDKKVLKDAETETVKNGVHRYFKFFLGDALNHNHYPKNVDITVSTGLGEFLNDDKLGDFYKIVHKNLNEGGVFITSAIDKHGLSDFLLRELSEIYTNYRSEGRIRSIISKVGFSKLKSYRDSYQLQTMIIATK